jgi:hypothetical protein
LNIKCIQTHLLFPLLKNLHVSWLAMYNRHLPTMLRSWSYGTWIYNYLCNQCLSPLTLWVWIPLRWSVLDTTLCDKVCQWLVTGCFSLDTPVSSTNKTDRHDITEIWLKVALNTINQTINLKSWNLINSVQEYGCQTFLDNILEWWLTLYP